MKRRFFSSLKRRFSLFRCTIAFLNLTVLFSTMYIILMILYVLTGVNPYLNLGKGTKVGMVDFEYGIPVPVRMSSGYLPDSSLFGNSSSGGSWASSGAYSKADLYKLLRNPDSVISASHIDTFVTEFKLWHGNTIIDSRKDQPIHIEDGYLTSGTLRVQTSKKGWRFLLLLPQVLSLSLLVFSAWQLARLLNDILSGAAFNAINYRRLRNIGWGVIAWQLILFTLYLRFMNWAIMINFNSTIPDYRAPFQLTAMYQYDLSLSWLTGGGILLILAYAFKKGTQLQQEQDLTV